MHDPMVVAFEIRRPWPHRSGIKPRGWYFPPVITVWHVEPGGHDAGEMCKHYRREQQPNGSWKMTILHGWKFHIHHWRIQVSPLQNLRRWALTRCAWCGGRHTRRDPVNTSHSWDGPRGRWWQGEPGLYHHDCSSISTAHAVCLCVDPLLLEHEGYGRCALCYRFRAFGAKESQLQRQRILAAVPWGQRDAVAYARVVALAADERLAS